MKNVETLLRENRAWAEETFRKIDKKFSAVTLRSRDKLPYGVDENGIHIDMTERRRNWWTNGFWGGLNWLLYAYTKNEEYRKTAKRSEELLRPVADEYGRLDHDVGFVWHLTFGADYLLTGDETAKNLDLYMAASLASRFILASKVPGGFIRAWNGKHGAAWDNYDRSIIDCMMNLPLLYWASDVTDDDRFARFAKAHADVTLRDHLRKDGSVNHIVDHDRETGELTGTQAGQGYAVGSSWSRGCSWAVYGFVLSYLHTKDERYLEGAKRAADYFIDCVKSDWLPRVDFRAPAEPVLYDSTAGACAACGLIELAKILPENEGGKYLDAAINLLRAMGEKFCDFDPANDHMLDYGTERYPADYTPEGMKKAGVHMSIIYGDFFYTEAVLKLLGATFTPW